MKNWIIPFGGLQRVCVLNDWVGCNESGVDVGAGRMEASRGQQSACDSSQELQKTAVGEAVVERVAWAARAS